MDGELVGPEVTYYADMPQGMKTGHVKSCYDQAMVHSTFYRTDRMS